MAYISGKSQVHMLQVTSMYGRTSIIRISIIRTLGYLNAIFNFKIPKNNLIFCKTK